MSAYTKVTITCDWPDCYGRIETHFSKITEARKWAAKFGWVRVGGVDLCGAKEQAETYDSDKRTLHGHAARTDHLPVTKFSQKGMVMLSCSCGWTKPAEYSWQKEGEVSGHMAGHYWSKHVKETLKASADES